MRRQRVFRDPTVTRADTSLIGEILGSVEETDATLFVMVTVLGQSLQQVARLLKLSEEQAKARLSVVTSRLRHPSRSQRIRDELSDGQTLVSAQLRGWTRDISGALFPRCAQCDTPFLPPNAALSRGGRPRRYCSSACRQAAYRRRLAAAEMAPEQPAPLPEQRVPSRPKPRNPRPALCLEYANNGGAHVGCLLHRGHRAEHLALCLAAGNRIMWGRWDSKDHGPFTWHPVCAVAEGPRPDAPACALPDGHRSTHVFTSTIWLDPWRRVGQSINLPRNLAIALRIRLSPLTGRPAGS